MSQIRTSEKNLPSTTAVDGKDRAQNSVRPHKQRSSSNPRSRVIIKKICLSITIIATITATFCGIKIALWWIDCQKIDQEAESALAAANLTDISIKDQDSQAFDPYWDFQNTNLLEADFGALQKINHEVLAWISVPSTNINYPVTRHADNEYYLNHSLTNSPNSGGWVFMDYRNQNFAQNANATTNYPQNTIIYAHGRQDRSMFGSLYKVLYRDWFNNFDNHIVKMSSPAANSIWQVFSVYQIPNTNDYIQTDFRNADFESFLNTIQDRSFFDFDVKLNPEDHILTLSTCANDREKIVLHAKLLYSQPR